MIAIFAKINLSHDIGLLGDTIVLHRHNNNEHEFEQDDLAKFAAVFGRSNALYDLTWAVKGENELVKQRGKFGSRPVGD